MVYKSNDDIVLNGVIGGIADNLKLDSDILRWAFIIGGILGYFYPLLIIYLIASWVMPIKEGYEK